MHLFFSIEKHGAIGHFSEAVFSFCLLLWHLIAVWYVCFH